MPHLVPPTVTVRASFVAAALEYAREDGYEPLDPVELRDPVAFLAYVDGLHEAARARPSSVAAPDPEAGPVTTLWWVDEDTYLGTLTLRDRLETEYLATYGGHVGYRVRPDVRGRGHATAMLAAALPLLSARGVDPALVTCDDGHEASRRVIVRNGGRLDDVRDGKLRFWVPTRSSAPS